MSYKKLFNKDKDYQKIVDQFQVEKNDLERKARMGVYKFTTLQEEAQAIFNKLNEAIKNHHDTRLSETRARIDELENGTPEKVGYADRPNEAKEFEMRYKLASDRELEYMVQDLNTDDLLEINLLRMELKNRGMEDQDKLIKRYIIRNDIGGMDNIDRNEYDKHKKNFATYNTVGKRGVFIDDKYTSLNSIESELMGIAKQTDQDERGAI